MKAERNLGHRVINQKRFSKKGFSLVELMTVVAIIGGLAALGVPQYRKFQRKARRAEAFKLLGETASLQRAFRANYNAITNSLGALGVKGNERPQFYSYGFSQADCSSVAISISIAGGAPSPGPVSGRPNFAFPNYHLAQVPARIMPPGSGPDALRTTRIHPPNPPAGSLSPNAAQPANLVCLPADIADGNRYTISASGVIGGSQPDHVQIDENRIITVEQDGT